MANNLTSNVETKLLKSFLKGAENKRVLSKSVDTQFNGQFNPNTGSTISVKRPHDAISHRTSGGDISGVTKSSIISGKATATVQDFITVAVEYEAVEEALELGGLDDILAPYAQRAVTDLEVDFASYMMKNCNLSVGDPDTAIGSWADVANAGALMHSIGAGGGEINFAMNSFTSVALANLQSGLSAGEGLVGEAWKNAMISKDFAGMRVLKSDALSTYTAGSLTDRAGTINGTPTVTYAGHKDTMIQSIPVTAFAAGTDTIKAGEVVEITGRYRLNLATRQPIVGSDGNQVKWRGVVTADVTLSGGAGTLLVAGPAIYESGGQYNTTSSAIANSDVITLLGTAATVYQPSLFYRKDAFTIAFCNIPKLAATDASVVTRDGLAIRCHKYSDGDANTQKVRFDILPAYGTLNPFYAGHCYG